MSRNLARRDCACCPAPRVFLVESPRPITEDEARPYFAEYRGMLVANAECVLCEAKYLAWIDATNRAQYARADYTSEPGEYFDLSYRASFNDEPAPEDLPVYAVDAVTTYTRVRTIRRCHHGSDLDRAPSEWDRGGCSGCRWEEKLRAARAARLWSVFWVPKSGARAACMDEDNFFETPEVPRAAEILARWQCATSDRGHYELSRWRPDDQVTR